MSSSHVRHLQSQTLTLVTIFLIWYAHARKYRAGGNSSLLGGGDEDPLKWTTLQVFMIVPASVGALYTMCDFANVDLEAIWGELQRRHSYERLLELTYAFNLAFYLVFGLVVLSWDLTGSCRRLKIQKEAKIDYARALPKLFVVLTLNNGLPLLARLFLPAERYEVLLSSLSAHVFRPNLSASPRLPSLLEISLHVWAFLMAYDVLFYYTHRLLHEPVFYKVSMKVRAREATTTRRRRRLPTHPFVSYSTFTSSTTSGSRRPHSLPPTRTQSSTSSRTSSPRLSRSWRSSRTSSPSTCL